MNIPLPTSENYTIYGGANCSFCVKAKKILANHANVIYYDIDTFGASRKETFDLLKKRGLIPENYKTIPLIFYKGVFLGGYTELNKQLDAFEALDPLISNDF